MRTFFKKAAPFLRAAAAAAICLICFFLVWFQFVRGSAVRTQSICLNDAYDTLTPPLLDGQSITQEFSTQGAVYGIGVYFQRLDPDVSGYIRVTLTDTDSRQVLMDVTGNIDQVLYDSYTPFSLNVPETDGSEHHWLLSLTPSYFTSKNELALQKSSRTQAGFGALTENGAAAGGTLALSVATQQLGGLPGRFFWVLGLLCSLAVFGLALLCQWRRPGKAALVFCAVFLLGLAYQFVLPAYSAPDEEMHYRTAYALSSSWLGVKPSQSDANFIERECDVIPDFSDFNTSPFTYRYLFQHLFDRAPAESRYIESSANLIQGYQMPYLFSAAGITLARLLRFGGVGTAFFGRLWNLFFFAAMAALAVHLAPLGKRLFAVFALLPTTLHMGGSYSYDCCLLAFCMVLLALCLRCAFQPQPVTRRQLAALLVLCFLLAPLKFIYLPLCLLVFLIPATQYASRRQCLLARACTIGLAGVHNIAYSWLTFYQMLLLSWSTAQTGGAPVGVLPVLAIRPAVALAAESAPLTTYSVFYLLQHPGVLLQLLGNTIFPNAARYAASILGGTLGYMNLSEIDVNGVLMAGFLLLLLFSCLPQTDRKAKLAVWQRLLLLALFCVVFVMLGAVCIYWTPVTYNYLWGFQGRYLLPLLPCLLLVLPTCRVQVSGDSFRGVLFSAFFLEILTLLNVFCVVFAR